MNKYVKYLGILFTGSWLIVTVVAGVQIGKSLIPPPVERYDVVDKDPSANSSSKIALFRVEGIIRGSNEVDANRVRLLCKEIRESAKDKDVKGMLLEINSPGGEVAASDTIRKAIDDFRLTGKPVVAYFDALAASGGYYIGSGADYIVCHPQCFTASIGVIIQAPNYQELFDKTGLKMYTFKSGKLKDMLNGARALNDEETLYTQSLVNDTYETFLQLVAKSRKIDAEKLRNGIADGRVVLGSKAVEANLVDSNGYFNDAVAKVRDMTGGKYRVEYQKINGRSGSILGTILGKQKIEVSIGNWSPETLTPGTPYMLYNGN